MLLSKTITAVTVGILLTATIAPATAAQDVCSLKPGLTQKDRVGSGDTSVVYERPVWSKSGALMFWTDMNVNTDGAPASYAAMHRFAAGKEPPRLNTLCNGAQLIVSDPVNGALRKGWPGKVRTVDARTKAGCQQLLDTVRLYGGGERDWRAEANGPWIDWYAIETVTGADRRTRPCVNGDYYVSMTNIPARPLKADRSKFHACEQTRWMNAMTIPAIVLPGGKNAFQAAGAAAGDFVVVYRPAKGARAASTVFAIVGDSGPADGLGEGTPALIQALRGGPALVPDKPATTNRYVLSEPVLTVVFPHTAPADAVFDDPTANASRAREQWIRVLGGGAEPVAQRQLEICATAIARAPAPPASPK